MCEMRKEGERRRQGKLKPCSNKTFFCKSEKVKNGRWPHPPAPG